MAFIVSKSNISVKIKREPLRDVKDVMLQFGYTSVSSLYASIKLGNFPKPDSYGIGTCIKGEDSCVTKKSYWFLSTINKEWGRVKVARANRAKVRKTLLTTEDVVKVFNFDNVRVISALISKGLFPPCDLLSNEDYVLQQGHSVNYWYMDTIISEINRRKKEVNVNKIHVGSLKILKILTTKTE